MTIKYSASTGGFYRTDMHDDIPADAVEVSDDQYAALLAGAAEGKILAAGANGYPELQDPPEKFVSDDDLRALRQEAYRMESDPMKIEAEYDAIIQGVDPDYTAWLAKVAEIKARYPLAADN